MPGKQELKEEDMKKIHAALKSAGISDDQEHVAKVSAALATHGLEPRAFGLHIFCNWKHLCLIVRE